MMYTYTTYTYVLDEVNKHALPALRSRGRRIEDAYGETTPPPNSIP